MISIIVPVYKAEHHLEKCLNSLLNQTYIDIEIILIDDGSPDKSGEICDSYAMKDQRIKVIHQKNRGVSNARQKGLEAAQGDYIIHADPDDWIEPTMCEELVKKAYEEDADLVICDYWAEEINKKIHMIEKPSAMSPHTILIEIINGKLHGSCWNKLIKRSTIINNNISFLPNINVLEDFLFNCKLLSLDNIKVSYLPKAYYHYNMTNDLSICHYPWKEKIQSEIDVLTELEMILDKNKFNNFYERKKSVFFGAIMANRMDIIEQLSPDIKLQYFQEKHHYGLFTPISNCISIALHGYPRVAYYYYQVHSFIIDLKNIIKR